MKNELILPDSFLAGIRSLIQSAEELRTEMEDSVRMLMELISPHTVVLYLRGEDGLFEISDFLSKSDEFIDNSQRLRFRNGYIAWALKTKTSVLVGDVKNSKKNLTYYTKSIPVKSFLAAPLFIRDERDSSSGEPAGVLIVDSTEKDAFGQREEKIFSLVSDRIRDILNSLQLSARFSACSEELKYYYVFAQKLSSTLDVDVILDYVTDALEEILGADIVGTALLNEDGSEAFLRRSGGNRRREVEGKNVPLKDTLMGLVAESGRMFSSEDLSVRTRYKNVFGKEIDFALDSKGIKSILIYPLFGVDVENEAQRVLGSIMAGRREKIPFDESERSFFEIVSREASKALSNALNLKKVDELSIREDLTGLYGLTYFEEILSYMLVRSDELSEELSLLLVEIDNLEEIGRVHGSRARKIAVMSAAKIIRESVRGVDISARFEGDRFAVALPNADMKQSREVAGKIIQRAREAILDLGGEELVYSISVGISSNNENRSSKHLLFDRANRALREAERESGNSFVHFSDISFEEVVV